jgi:colanic acid/amylovoran biosynthesis glycosyltransferase
MKIAFLVNRFPTVTETFILNQITGLIDRGHEVDIFAPQLGDEREAHPQVQAYKLLGRLHLSPGATDRVGQLHAWLRHGPQAVRDARKMPWHLHRDRSTVSMSLPLLPRAFDGCGPYDVTHCQFGVLGVWGAWLRDIGVNTGPIVTSFRGRDGYRSLPHAPWLHRWLFERGDLFLPVSEHLADRLVHYGCPRDKIAVHHSGIDCSQFAYRPRAAPGDRPLCVITIGRLAPMKGIEYAIDAIATLRRSGMMIEHTIVGAGPLRDVLQRQIDQSRLGDTVRLVGTMPQDKLRLLMDECDVMLHPSVTAHDGISEGIPNTVKEAMAVGIPVIATYHSGIPELVTDGESGLLVPERDVRALVGCMRRLIADPPLWPRLAEAARRKVEAEFDSNALNDELVQLYHSVNARRSGES